MSHCLADSGRKQDQEQAEDALNFKFSSRNWGGGHCDLPGFARARKDSLGQYRGPVAFTGWVRVWLAHFPLLALRQG